MTGRNPSRRIDERGLVVVGSIAVAVVTVLVTVPWLGFVHDDLILARRAAVTLLSPDALDTYAQNPLAQMGPLAIALSRLPTPVYEVGVAALIGVVAPLLVVSSRRGVRLRQAVATAVVWGAVVPVPWSQLAFKGHADDALVLLGAAALLAGRARGSTRWQLGGATLGLLAKPTAIVLVAALLPSVPAFALGVAVAALVWGPFALHDPASLLEAGKGVISIVRGSLEDWLGLPVGSLPPGWVRPLQAVAGIAAVLVSLARDRVAEGLMLAFAVRALLEPNPAPAYAIPLVVLALVPDLTFGLPVFTLISTVAFYESQATLYGGGTGVPRLVALASVVILAAVSLALPHGARPRILARRPPPSSTDPSEAPAVIPSVG